MPTALDQSLLASLKAEQFSTLSSSGAQNSTGNSTVHCDAKCMQARAVVQARMKRLQDDIDNDFQNMIKYGENAVYVPPPRSVEQQVMDGSLFRRKDDDGPPPPVFNDDSLIRQIPDSSNPKLSSAQVEANEKNLEKTLPTANDLLKTIQDQEKDAHTNGSFLVNAALSCTNSVVQVMQDAMEGAKGNSVVASPSTKQSSIAASFPQVISSSPSLSEPKSTEEAKANPTSSATSASDTSSDTSAWAKAFSFMKPKGGSGSTTGDTKDPLKSDGFLSGIFN
ncbi:hypothetical protein GUITHDRAFT_134532 [Guillardia theta CCMP2712]|uniref:Uncharacterized protein n=1 Tax=Guillardia theta (strain CCMP2712) TaxID=905079 RepID=L1JT74_GUITC|nr:hypothetical protein GUITHDRAFT_134532 [Guillardia theta CCMP2712]EKX51642.1 hypothetical protein GUITHDRAFT_134532 [Guillardia theta CCMP2712]|eukprot:XP_005838622.1 hypothetical protein GUITHDRAFT_134532 [Guillardia theta CCMP2712]